jgi:hypothetical protein
LHYPFSSPVGPFFLNVTTSEKKNGFLLIETFRKLFNPQNDDHQSSILGGLFLYCRVSKNLVYLPILAFWNNVRELVINL